MESTTEFNEDSELMIYSTYNTEYFTHTRGTNIHVFHILVNFYSLQYPYREQSLKKRRDCQQHSTKYALPTRRKIPIGRNRCACQSNFISSNFV